MRNPYRLKEIINLGRVTTLLFTLIGGTLLLGGCSDPEGRGEGVTDAQMQQAEAIRDLLVANCPLEASADDVMAFTECSVGLRDKGKALRNQYFSNGRAHWGGFNEEKHQNYRFNAEAKKTTSFDWITWFSLYGSLERYGEMMNVRLDAEGNLIIEIEAAFRNRLPAGYYAYFFWHKRDKWRAYENLTKIVFVFSPLGETIGVYRVGKGNDRVTPLTESELAEMPFEGDWDADMPMIATFENIVDRGAENLPRMVNTYRELKETLRYDGGDGCFQCHTPDSHPTINDLVFFTYGPQAAAEACEIPKTLRGMGSIDMPPDMDSLDPEARENIAVKADAFCEAKKALFMEIGEPF